MMDPQDFDALLALYGARLWSCDVNQHLMVVYTHARALSGALYRTVIFMDGSDMKLENAEGLAALARSSGLTFERCTSHPWKPVQ